MKFFFVLSIFLCFLFSIKTEASRTDQLKSVSESSSAGKIDALKTLEALELIIEDYSIWVNNTAKIFCA